MKNVLIVEDFQPMAKALKALLEGSGHQVTCVAGAQSYQVTDGGVILVGLTEGGQTEEVDCRQFQIAFVDGQLEGNMQGPAFVALLVQSKVACCGTSCQTDLNSEMLAQGATIAAKKPVVFCALLSQRLSADAVLAPTQVEKLQLADIESNFCNPEFQALSDQADAIIMSYLPRH